MQLRRGLPLHAEALGRLDAAAVERVRAEATPDVRGPEELHDLLLSAVVWRPHDEYRAWFEALAETGRAALAVRDGTEAWCTVERRGWVEVLWPEAEFVPDVRVSDSHSATCGAASMEEEAVAAEVVRGHLDVSGPVTVAELVARTGLRPGAVHVGLARLEAEGFAMRGRFDPSAASSPEVEQEEQWCARRLLARIHAYTQHRLRREIEPVSAQEFMRFLLGWQHVAPGTQRQGRAGVLAVVDQLQGFEIPSGAWEESILPARVEAFQHRWLEDLCLAGELVWGRLSLRPADSEDAPRRGSATPSRATPVTFALREDLPWLISAARGAAQPTEPAHGAAREVLDVLRTHGAMFHGELRKATGRLPVEVEEGLWDLVARGIVTADGFQAVRSLLSARDAWRRRHRQEQRMRVGGRRAPTWREGGEGRWALLPAHGSDEDRDTLAEQVAGQLLARWGVVFWDLMARESVALPWREVLWALRRLEARGVARGGRFVTGFSGEQYALPEAVEDLRRVRRTQRNGETVRLSGADPLNLVGIVLPGTRVTAVRTNSVTYRDGSVAVEEDGAAAGNGRTPRPVRSSSA